MKARTGFFLALLLVAAVFCVGGAFWIHRGFRARSTPTASEAYLARKIRNFAIPTSERHSKNTLDATPENLQQARELFIEHCASCHGLDGSARTQLGENLYPRVPDLRATQTQTLTDGELHYIIENGVQLTGMPAFTDLHAGPPRGAWLLVFYVRNLAAQSQAQKSEHAATSSTAHFVGSQACAKCHAEIYQRWKKTPMANVVRDPREHPDAIIPDLKTNHIAPFTKEQVALVYGSLWKQRYFTKVGDDYFPLNAQWEVKNKKWSKYHVADGADWWVPFYPADNAGRPTGPLCDGCHSVGYDVHTKQVTEWNVGCERCHGPGSEHASRPLRENIVNPAGMNYVDASDSCIQCHSQGRPLTDPIDGKHYDWPVGYDTGRNHLRDYWKLEQVDLGKTDFYYFPDGTAHKNRMQGNDFVQSVMYTRGITCFDCHDVHGSSNYAQLRKPAQQLCLDCHGPQSPNGPRTATIEEHTHHKKGSAGSECIACHMPQIETEGPPNTFVRSHTFKFITPSLTVKYKIPNPCNSCHADKSPEWSAQTISQWSERSPWRDN
jgi:predicted CXXCH cytochrome family protein